MNVQNQYGRGTGKNSGSFTGSSFFSDVSITLSDDDIHNQIQSLNRNRMTVDSAWNNSKRLLTFAIPD
jgi:hypothetical protein